MADIANFLLFPEKCLCELEAHQDLIDKMKKEIESLNKDKAALNFKI